MREIEKYTYEIQEYGNIGIQEYKNKGIYEYTKCRNNTNTGIIQIHENTNTRKYKYTISYQCKLKARTKSD